MSMFNRMALMFGFMCDPSVTVFCVSPKWPIGCDVETDLKHIRRLSWLMLISSLKYAYVNKDNPNNTEE